MQKDVEDADIANLTYNMAMKARYVLVPLVAVIGGLAAWVALANPGSDNDLALLETPAYPVVVIPRSALSKKPIIDWYIPILGAVTIPSKVAPSDYVDNVQVGGLMYSAISMTPGVPTDVTGLLWFHNFNQLDFGENHKVEIPNIPTTGSTPSHAVGAGYMVLPYVFGTKPREVTLRYDPALVMYSPKPPTIAPASLRVRLPANGLEPNMKPVDVQVGTWKVRLTPHWFSPSVPLLIDIQVLGLAASDDLWVQVEREGVSLNEFRIKGNSLKTLVWKRWDKNQNLSVHITAVKPESRAVQVSVMTSTDRGIARRVKLLWEEGPTLLDVKMLAGIRTAQAEDPKGFLAVFIGDKLAAGDEIREVVGGPDWCWDPNSVKDGQILQATCYRAVQTAVANITLPYPASKAFRSWEKEEDSY